MTAAWLLQQGAIPTTPMELIRQSTTVTQVVLVVLAILSLISWGVIFWTWTQLSTANSRAQKFAQEFDRDARQVQVVLDEAENAPPTAAAAESTSRTLSISGRRP